MMVMVMMAATTSGTLTLSLYLLSSLPGSCHLTLPSPQPRDSGAIKCILQRRKGHRERKAWTSDRVPEAQPLFLP